MQAQQEVECLKTTDSKAVDFNEMKIETKMCGLCRKDIELAKFRIHEVMCARMNYRCKKCDQLVAKSEKEFHDEEECGKPPKQEVIPIIKNDNVSPLTQSSLIHQSAELSQQKIKPPVQQNEEEKEMEQPSSFDFGAFENTDEANEREIQRILQEEMNQMDAQAIESQVHQVDENMPMSNYERSKLKTAQLRAQYGDCPELWPEGVRPADESKEQQLIGGDDEQPEGYSFMGMVQNFTNSLGFGHQNSNTDDAMAVNDKNGLMMPTQSFNRSNSQNGFEPESSNQKTINDYFSNQKWVEPDQKQNEPEPVIDDEFQQLQAQTEMEALEEQMLKEIMEQSMKEQQEPSSLQNLEDLE